MTATYISKLKPTTNKSNQKLFFIQIGTKQNNNKRQTKPSLSPLGLELVLVLLSFQNYRAWVI